MYLLQIQEILTDTHQMFLAYTQLEHETINNIIQLSRIKKIL